MAHLNNEATAVNRIAEVADTAASAAGSPPLKLKPRQPAPASIAAAPTPAPSQVNDLAREFVLELIRHRQNYEPTAIIGEAFGLARAFAVESAKPQ